MTIRNLAASLLLTALGVSGVSYAQTAAQSPEAPAPPAVLEQVPPTDVPEPQAGQVEAPEPVVHETVEAEGEGPPEGHFSTKDCPEGFTGNHGAYVSSVPPAERSTAAKSDCGKPVAAVEKADGTEDLGAEGDDGAGRPDHAGPPKDVPGHAKRGGPRG